MVRMCAGACLVTGMSSNKVVIKLLSVTNSTDNRGVGPCGKDQCRRWDKSYLMPNVSCSLLSISSLHYNKERTSDAKIMSFQIFKCIVLVAKFILNNNVMRMPLVVNLYNKFILYPFVGWRVSKNTFRMPDLTNYRICNKEKAGRGGRTLQQATHPFTDEVQFLCPRHLVKWTVICIPACISRNRFQNDQLGQLKESIPSLNHRKTVYREMLFLDC